MNQVKRVGAAEIEFTSTPVSGARNHCPMCKSMASEPLLNVTDTPINHTSLHMVRCLNCGTGYFNNEEPVVGYDDEGFGSDYWLNYVQNGAGITAMLEPLLAVTRPRTGKLLDVGCGFGFVPHFWTDSGFGEAIGLETSPYGKAGRDKLGLRIIPKFYSEAVEIHDERFDYVFSSEVIEHVEDPGGFVNEIGAALAEDGILVLTTPSASALEKETSYIDLLATLSPEFHFFVASHTGLENLLKECGFEHVEVRDLGHRLFAWASHKPLPELADGFNEWDLYLSYLERLADNEDPHVAGGALYRCFKDSVNLSKTQISTRIYPRFEALAKETYGIDFADPSSISTNRDVPRTIDWTRFPAWLGVALFHVGKHLKKTTASSQKLTSIFEASVAEMEREIAASKQFAGEPAHFLPIARLEASNARLKGYAAEHGEPTDRLPAYILKKPETLDDKDVCLVAIYAPTGQVSKATGRYLSELRRHGFTPVACLAVNDITQAVEMENLDGAEGVFVRQNGGMDFAMWAAALRHFPGAWVAKRLILTNDSILVLPDLFESFAKRLRSSDAPFVGLTESHQFQQHVQSYFLMMQGEALKDERVQRYWNSVQVHKKKNDIIQTYELKLLERFTITWGMKADVLYAFERILPDVDVAVLEKVNPSIVYWEYLISCGMPFIKGQLIRENPYDMRIEHWRTLARNHGAVVEEIEDHTAVFRPNALGKKRNISIRRSARRALGFLRNAIRFR